MRLNLISDITLKAKDRFGKDKDFKEVAKGGLTSFIINLIGLVAGYVFVMLISKIYKDSAAAIYGQYIIITLLIRMGSIVARFGTDTTMLQLSAAFLTKNFWGNIIETNRRLLKMLWSMGIGVFFLTIILSKQIAYVLHIPKHMVIISSIFVLPMSLGLYYSQGLRGLKKAGISSFLRSSALPVFNFLLLPLFLLFVKKNAVYFDDLPVYTYFVSIIIAAFIGFVYWDRSAANGIKYERLYNLTLSKTIQELFKASYPFLLAESMVFIVIWVDQFMLGILGNNQDVGIFNICIKYAMVASLSLQAVNTIAAPKFSEFFFKKDNEGLAQNVQKTTKMIFWTTVPIVIVYFIFAKFLLGIFGAVFIQGSAAFIILTIGALVNVMTGSTGILLQMTNNQKTLQNILLFTLALDVVLNYFLIPRYGTTGAAIANTFCSCLQNLIMVFYIKKYFNFYSVYPTIK